MPLKHHIMHSSEIHSCEIVVKMHLGWPTFNKIPSQHLWQARRDIDVTRVPDVSTTRQRLTKKKDKNPFWWCQAAISELRFTNHSQWQQESWEARFENGFAFDLITCNDTEKNDVLTSHSLTQNRQQLESKRTSFWHIADIQKDPWRKNCLETC